MEIWRSLERRLHVQEHRQCPGSTEKNVLFLTFPSIPAAAHLVPAGQVLPGSSAGIQFSSCLLPSVPCLTSRLLLHRYTNIHWDSWRHVAEVRTYTQGHWGWRGRQSKKMTENPSESPVSWGKKRDHREFYFLPLTHKHSPQCCSGSKAWHECFTRRRAHQRKCFSVHSLF